MLAASRRLLEALKWHGVAMVEFKRRADGSFALMEINPRLWGSLALSIGAGVDFPLSLWKIAGGENLPPQRPYAPGLRMRHLSADLVWLKANLFANRGNPLLLTRPRLVSLLEPLLLFAGRENWDHFSWADPAPGLRELKQVAHVVLRAGERQRQLRTLLSRRDGIIRRAVRRIQAARASRKPSIVFLCQGNVCRSPFAAMLARDRLGGFQIDSAGFDRRANRVPPANVAEGAAVLGYDMTQCRSTPLTEDLLRAADLVCFMDFGQWDQLAETYPRFRESSVPLGLFADPPVVEIEDPDRQDAATTRRVLLQIVSAVDGLAGKLGAAQGAGNGARTGRVASQSES